MRLGEEFLLTFMFDEERALQQDELLSEQTLPMALPTEGRETINPVLHQEPKVDLERQRQAGTRTRVQVGGPVTVSRVLSRTVTGTISSDPKPDQTHGRACWMRSEAVGAACTVG